VHYGHNYFGADAELFEKYYTDLNCIKIADNQAVTVDGERVKTFTAPESNIPEIPLM